MSTIISGIIIQMKWDKQKKHVFTLQNLASKWLYRPVNSKRGSLYITCDFSQGIVGFILVTHVSNKNNVFKKTLIFPGSKKVENREHVTEKML
jgi:hypothetical protein